MVSTKNGTGDILLFCALRCALFFLSKTQDDALFLSATKNFWFVTRFRMPQVVAMHGYALCRPQTFFPRPFDSNCSSKQRWLFPYHRKGKKNPIERANKQDNGDDEQIRSTAATVGRRRTTSLGGNRRGATQSISRRYRNTQKFSQDDVFEGLKSAYWVFFHVDFDSRHEKV